MLKKKCHIDKPKVVQIRDLSNFDLELFLQVENNDTVNEQFDKFCVTFNSVVNKFAHMQ